MPRLSEALDASGVCSQGSKPSLPPAGKCSRTQSLGEISPLLTGVSKVGVDLVAHLHRVAAVDEDHRLSAIDDAPCPPSR